MVLQYLGSGRDDQSENLDISMNAVHISSFDESLKKKMISHRDWVDFVRYDTRVSGRDIVRTVIDRNQLTVLS